MADETKFPAEHIARLRTALRQFLAVCEEALHINRSLVESEQQRFHDELVQVTFVLFGVVWCCLVCGVVCCGVFGGVWWC